MSTNTEQPRASGPMDIDGEPGAEPDGVHAQQTFVTGDEELLTNCQLDTIQRDPQLRPTFQKVWLWSSKHNVRTEMNYEPTNEKMARIPGAHELSKESDKPDGDRSDLCQEYLVVGMIIADNPAKTHQTGANGGSGRKKQTFKASDLRLHRAVVACSDDRPGKCVTLVACEPWSGRCSTKVTTKKNVFFFPEFLAHIPDQEWTSSNTKRRDNFIGRHILSYSTKNDTRPTEAIPVVNDNFVKAITANPLAQAKSENLAHQMVMQLSLLQREPTVTQFKRMKALLLNAAPGLRFGPENPDAVYIEFFDEQEQYSILQATQLADILREHVSEIQPSHIIAFRSILVRMSLLERLTPADLVFFMGACIIDERCGRGPVNDAAVEALVEQTELRNRLQTPIIAADSEIVISAKDARHVLCIIKVALHSWKRYLDDVSSNLREQHGSVLEYVDMRDIMDRLKEVVDAHTAGMLYTQALAVNAAQASGANGVLIKEIDAMLKYIDEVLGGELRDSE
ncbi:unnamed protein product [Zymoseptoria tritici ST99CH_1E4]|uniref:Uncharacterized protein n=1 Tax=Zymoseptoria tritici ST99CH_1E4 TaxID=1276532 RepID=A0A2H1GNK3_ZYMTR|nr:unnamed protein product [Zymoseptoria tritici ST99CH_1E4]